MNGESRGFGFVTFAHASCAASAMVNMAGAVLGGPFQDAPLKVAPSARDRQAQVRGPYRLDCLVCVNLPSACVLLGSRPELVHAADRSMSWTQRHV